MVGSISLLKVTFFITGTIYINYGSCSECASEPEPEPEPESASFVCPDYPADLTLSLNNSVTSKGKSFTNPIDLYWSVGMTQQTITADWNSANIGNATPNLIPASLSGYVSKTISSTGNNNKRMTIIVNNNQVNYSTVKVLACYFQEEAIQTCSHEIYIRHNLSGPGGDPDGPGGGDPNDPPSKDQG